MRNGMEKSPYYIYILIFMKHLTNILVFLWEKKHREVHKQNTVCDGSNLYIKLADNQVRLSASIAYAILFYLVHPNI